MCPLPRKGFNFKHTFCATFLTMSLMEQPPRWFPLIPMFVCLSDFSAECRLQWERQLLHAVDVELCYVTLFHSSNFHFQLPINIPNNSMMAIYKEASLICSFKLCSIATMLDSSEAFLYYSISVKDCGPLVIPNADYTTVLNTTYKSVVIYSCADSTNRTSLMAVCTQEGVWTYQRCVIACEYTGQ